MPRNAMKSRGDAINHYNGLRLRVIGAGSLQVNSYAFSGDNDNPDVLVETLVPYTMASATKVEPTLLMNAKEFRLSIEVKVTEINEYFEIQRMVVFMKPLFTGVPGRG